MMSQAFANVGPTMSRAFANVGPTMSRAFANVGPIMSRAFANGGPTKARRTTRHWANDGPRQWPNIGADIGPTLAHHRCAVWAPMSESKRFT